MYISVKKDPAELSELEDRGFYQKPQRFIIESFRGFLQKTKYGLPLKNYSKFHLADCPKKPL